MGMPVGASGGFSARIATPIIQQQARPAAPPPAPKAASNTAAKVLEEALNSQGPLGTMLNKKV